MSPPAAPSTSPPPPKPLVLVPGCNRMLNGHPFHVIGKKYIDAVRLAGCTPLIMPTASFDELGDELEALLAIAHGLLLTGSASNVHPSHFDEAVRDPALPLDPQRDAWTLPLIPRALARGMPLFGICRGFQEVNVALGGSLHQAVQELPDRRDHRADSSAAPEIQYGLAHEVVIQPGGVLEGMLADVPGAPRIHVNSVHGQGVNRLAAGLRIEALAPDGLVEAFSISAARGFNVCVQWHPEWQAASNPVSLRLLQAFGSACEGYRDRHSVPSPQTSKPPDRGR
jgi:putative glutamine amidotransferase